MLKLDVLWNCVICPRLEVSEKSEKSEECEESEESEE